LVLRAHKETLKTEILWLRKGVSLSLLWTVFTSCNSGDSVVVIVLCLEYEPGDPGFEYRERKGIFLFSKMSTPALGPTLSMLRNRVLSWGKAATHRHLVLSVTVSGGHSSSSSAECNSEWSFTATSEYLHPTNSENLTFTFAVSLM